MDQFRGVAIVGEVPERSVSGIYLIRNNVNGKVYVGSAVSIYGRIYSHAWHLSRGSHKNKKLLAAWRKHGGAAFTAGVLEVVADKADLVRREQHWIDSLSAVAKGYNLNPVAGNDIGVTRTPGYRQKISATVRAYFVDPENRRKTSLATKRGMQRPEVREKCRQAMLRRLADPQERAKIAAALYTPEMRERIAEINRQTAAAWTPVERAAHSARVCQYFLTLPAEKKAENDARLARARASVTPEGRVRQARAASRAYAVVHPDGRSEDIVNLTQFCILHDIPYSSAIRQLTGRISKARGYTFEKTGAVPCQS